MKLITFVFTILLIEQFNSTPCKCSDLILETDCAKNDVCHWDTTCKEQACDALDEPKCQKRKDCYVSASGCVPLPTTCDGFNYPISFDPEAHFMRCFLHDCEPKTDFQGCAVKSCTSYTGTFAQICEAIPFCYLSGSDCVLITDCSIQFASDLTLCEAQQPYCINFGGQACLNVMDLSCGDIPIDSQCNDPDLMPLKEKLCQWGASCESLSLYDSCDKFTVQARCERAITACQWVNQACVPIDISSLTVDTCFINSRFEAFWDGTECKYCKSPEQITYEKSLMEEENNDNAVEEEDENDDNHGVQLAAWVVVAMLGMIQ